MNAGAENRKAWLFVAIVFAAVWLLIAAMNLAGLKDADADPTQARDTGCPSGSAYFSYTKWRSLDSQPFGTELAYGIRKAEMCDKGRNLGLKAGIAGTVITTSGDRSGWSGEVMKKNTGCVEGTWDFCKRAIWSATYRFTQGTVVIPENTEWMKILLRCNWQRNCSWESSEWG